MNPKWDELTRAQQDLYLTLLWEDGYSEQAIADFLDSTKGTIVRRRHTGLKLSTGNRPVVKQVVELEQFQDLLDLHAMAEMRKRGVEPATPPKYKMAASEASQCEHVGDNGMRCGFECEIVSRSGKKFCRMHG